MYNIELCLVIQKENSKYSNYMCLYRYDNYVEKVLPFSGFFFRSVSFKKELTSQIIPIHSDFIPMHSDFVDSYDSFHMNVDKCIEALKDKMVNALRRGFNALTEYSRDDVFGTLPCGSSESEIMMKMELMGFK